MTHTKNDVLEYAADNDVKFIRLQFCDIFGNLKNMTIMPSQLERAFEYGINFDASSINGFLNVEESDLLLFPDPETLSVLPWRPQQGKVIRLFCDIRKPDSAPFEGDSRYILKKTVEKYEKLGYTVNVGPECEFFLFETDSDGKPLLKPHDNADYLAVAPFDKGENIRREICLTLEEMGFVIEASHHECAVGQHEIDFRYTSPLQAADNFVTFKTVVKTAAGRSGLYASFMPKPLNGISGSGLHINLSVRKNGEDVIYKNPDGSLSAQAGSFIAGIIGHIKGITAIANPIVNSYKRLGSGYQAPRYISWSEKNRSQLIRIPAENGEPCRIELRSPDPACNPYLLIALLMEAGLQGIESGLAASEHTGINVYQATAHQLEGIDQLPGDLLSAVEFMKKDEMIAEILGKHLYEKYVSAKLSEWNEYVNIVHNWEIDRYLINV